MEHIKITTKYFFLNFKNLNTSQFYEARAQNTNKRTYIKITRQQENVKHGLSELN